jgi:hypothetical protein
MVDVLTFVHTILANKYGFTLETTEFTLLDCLLHR